VEVGHVSDILVVLVGCILQMSDGPQRIRGKLWLEQHMLARDSFNKSCESPFSHASPATCAEIVLPVLRSDGDLNEN
jgi:hypothetical protein